MVFLFSSAGRDGKYFFLRRRGTVNTFSEAGRDGKYMFHLSRCKVGAVVRTRRISLTLLVPRQVTL